MSHEEIKQLESDIKSEKAEKIIEVMEKPEEDEDELSTNGEDQT
jgi:hypothetical protein